MQPLAYRASRAPGCASTAPLWAFKAPAASTATEFHADPDPAFHFDMVPNPDPAFRKYADPEPAFQFYANLVRLFTLSGSDFLI